MRWLYGVVAAVSVIVRQFYLPNPFECFGDVALIINWVAEPIIHTIAAVVVGLVYRKGECPPLGSLLYLGAYSAVVGVLSIMGIFSFAWWWVTIISILFIVICVYLAKLRRWFDGNPW